MLSTTSTACSSQGNPPACAPFRDPINKYPHTIAGETWTEIAPFSLRWVIRAVAWITTG